MNSQDGRIEHLLELLSEHLEMDRLSEWEEEFFDSVSSQFGNRGDLTDRQIEKLEEINRKAWESVY